jgi:hypothetical protein
VLAARFEKPGLGQRCEVAGDVADGDADGVGDAGLREAGRDAAGLGAPLVGVRDVEEDPLTDR